MLLAVVLTVAVMSCSDNGSGANATFSMKTDNTVSKTGIADTVIIDTAKVLITRLKFNGSGGDSNDIRVGPFVVNLNLSGGIQTAASASIPQGTYDKVKFELHKPDASESLPDQDFIDGPASNQRYSVIIIGRFNGVRFVYKSKSTINETIDINPPLIVADSIGTANVTLLVNPTLFFKKNSVYLDPSDTGSGNISDIDNSVKDAFKKALRDDHKTGLGN